jgi:two-component system, OmpR family, sensor kinase
MKSMRSLQARLAIGIGLLVTILWIAVASVTATLLSREMDVEFDSALQETAQRILPVAVFDILGREDDDTAQIIASIREHDEFFTYVVRDGKGRILLQSHKADPANFPPYQGTGFSQNTHFRFYSDAALRGSITITVAEPLDHRRQVARSMQINLGLPLLAMVPLSLAGIAFAVQRNFAPLRRLREALAARSASDLSPIEVDEQLPTEIEPVVEELNELLSELTAAFEAERAFAANAAHELRTPLAGAIAQAQRLQTEATDENSKKRAGEIETTLKRLTRLSERLMQLARVEGGRLKTEDFNDLRPVLNLVTDDIRLLSRATEIDLSMPEKPVMSDLDPDAFGILCRNLIDNAQRHGQPGHAIKVALDEYGVLRVINEAAPIGPDTLAHLTERFERGGKTNEGSGLGLAIVRTICERGGGEMHLYSPATNQTSGFEVVVRLHVEKPQN